MPVTYTGILPDLFREGQGVVAEGRIEDGVFVADEVLAKHDENYMPPEVADALKKSGQWQHMRDADGAGRPDAARSGDDDRRNRPFRADPRACRRAACRAPCR